METKKLTYLDVLNETIEFYSKNPRCEIDGVCKYIIKGIPNSCAFGRYINNLDDFLIENSEYINASSTTILCDFGFDILKEEVRHLKSNSFWSDLQKLHDNNGFWSNNSLSTTGERRKELFILDIKTNVYGQQE